MTSSPTVPHDTPGKERPRHQFSLRAIFLVTTALAVGLGLPLVKWGVLTVAAVVGLLAVLIIVQTPIFLAMWLCGWLPRLEALKEDGGPPG